ncbi:hypothetical protein [Stratiformator vulcanicus]|uniref:Uncharacterized protein n=1 Tax=Stratiformator vulcanicus TaxID=2527980 RepID=A0A517R2U3_9PLAN|nr:hypothetical protein [Stratiformator vulcanicus]QDT38174.1 hypothetical protein Pan189_25640 [Stratiformator vulcanicus]
MQIAEMLGRQHATPSILAGVLSIGGGLLAFGLAEARDDRDEVTEFVASRDAAYEAVSKMLNTPAEGLTRTLPTEPLNVQYRFRKASIEAVRLSLQNGPWSAHRFLVAAYSTETKDRLRDDALDPDRFNSIDKTLDLLVAELDNHGFVSRKPASISRHRSDREILLRRDGPGHIEVLARASWDPEERGWFLNLRINESFEQ